ncbi:MAG TPA: hypothetical protein VLF18_11150 [Tahibacter sp.]|uniref:hypothetical protein n=1 Tax=Tahibacter sp. TaxID=2056211 RepID=UPI002D00AF02|nr:hypothetical protein [Tahibacter sp.]HSX60745.1 hypothetical protein [Tahibacter sp.]
MIELIALVDATQFRSDAAAADRLAPITDAQVSRFDDALVAIGAVRQRRMLALARREIVIRFASLPADERHAAIAAHHLAGGRRLWAIESRVDVDDLQRCLCAYLESTGRIPTTLPPPEAPVAIAQSLDGPRSTWAGDGGIGSRHLFVLRDEPSITPLVRAWIASSPATSHADARDITPVVGHFATDRPARTQYAPTFAQAIVGELRPGASAAFVAEPYWMFGRGRPPADDLARVVSSFRWALFQWNAPVYDRLLAFVCDDEALAIRFEKHLEDFDVAPISTFRRVDALRGVAGGLTVSEDDAFGEIAFVAAEHDDRAPWLVLCAYGTPGHWWRAITMRLQPQFLHFSSIGGHPLLMLAFRNVDPVTWRELWSRLGHDDNVAIAAVSGRVTAGDLRERLVRVKNEVSIDNLRYLAGDRGWAYAHLRGGGADEHWVLFFATDAAVTARVADFAHRQWPAQARYLAYW